MGDNYECLGNDAILPSSPPTAVATSPAAPLNVGNSKKENDRAGDSIIAPSKLKVNPIFSEIEAINNKKKGCCCTICLILLLPTFQSNKTVDRLF
uniref:Uncharacterized protein n=1 Tax=Rhabditophanes sp. KR3021 TaxID=114890 RepID=A0AC35TJQ5_9BILA